MAPIATARKARGRLRLHRTSAGALAISGASVLRLGLQFALLPILARYVGPAEYGLMALAMPVILLANVLADGGLGYALGRQPEADRALESTAFWLTGAIGMVLAAVCALAAVPMGAIMDQPRLPLLIAALSPILLMNALTAVSNGRIIREGRFAAFAGGDLLSTGAGAVVALIAAAHGWGAWSLVAQQLVLWIVKLAWVTFAGRVRIGLIWNFPAIRPLLGFGAGAIGGLLADFAARNLDSLIIGGVLGATSLGFYAMAYQIIRMPDMLISGPAQLYIFTAASRVQARGAQAAADLAVGALRLGALAFAPVFAGLCLVASPAVHLLLGERWVSVIPVLQWLAPAGFGFCLCAIASAVALGLGRAALQFSQSAILAVVAVVAVALSARFGLVAASGALSAGVVAVAGMSVIRLGRALEIRPGPLAGAFLPSLASAPMAAAVWSVGRLAAAWAPGLQLALMVGAGLIVYGLALLPFRRLVAADATRFSKAQSEVQAVAPAG